MHLVVVSSHPIQYQAPLFRELAQRIDLTVLFAHSATPIDQAKAGFGVAFDWDTDLLSGYRHQFLPNISQRPGPDHFDGCDTPAVGPALSHKRFDALLVMGWRLKSYVQAIWNAKRLGMPVMVRGDSQLGTPRGPLKTMGKAASYPLLLRTFDAALYVGQRSRQYYRHYHYPERRLFFSPHCVDTVKFEVTATPAVRQRMREKLRIPTDALVVLFVGKLLPFKRPLDVIVACGLMRQQGFSVHVLVAGSGELSGEMIKLAAYHCVPLHMLGFQNQSAMPGVYAASDVLALPSESETWGLVCNESIACGVPIVVSDAVGCAPDLAADKAVGRVYPTGDVAALASALTSALTTRQSAEAFALKSASYSLSAATDGVEKALNFVTQVDVDRP